MATIRVSDFTSFINAVTTADADVIIDNDLDANGWTARRTDWSCKSVNGGGHAIRNIQATFSDGYSPFRLTRGDGCTISNVKFLNLVLTPGTPWGLSFIYGASNSNHIKNCEFQGLMQCQRLIDGGFYEITQCTFSQKAGSYGRLLEIRPDLDTPNDVISECYFDLNATTGEYFTSSIITFSTSLNTAKVSNCYFKGYLKVPTNDTITINGVIHNCVINVDFTADSNVNTFKIGNTSINLNGVSLYNTTKIASNLTVASQDDLVGLSDPELKYPGGLTAIPPTGFPLII